MPKMHEQVQSLRNGCSSMSTKLVASGRPLLQRHLSKRASRFVAIATRLRESPSQFARTMATTCLFTWTMKGYGTRSKRPRLRLARPTLQVLGGTQRLPHMRVLSLRCQALKSPPNSHENSTRGAGADVDRILSLLRIAQHYRNSVAKPTPICMSTDDETYFQDCTHCYLCGNAFTSVDRKHRGWGMVISMVASMEPHTASTTSMQRPRIISWCGFTM